jgi:hypothetical protein
LAESLGEGFVAAATTGENVEDEVLDQVVPEEIGGPFIETRDTQEFALGSDDMNPEEAEPEPLPRAVSGLVSAPASEGYAARGGEDGDASLAGGDEHADADEATDQASGEALDERFNDPGGGGAHFDQLNASSAVAPRSSRRR